MREVEGENVQLNEVPYRSTVAKVNQVRGEKLPDGDQ